jgi:acyl-homoserine-lactone acylase
MKRLALLFPLALACTKTCALPAATVNHNAEFARSVTIYRDTYGVSHIFGPTDANCVFGHAYAQAEDNFWQIEDSYLRALGRASEVYGKKTLDDDLVIRTLEIPRLAKAEYKHAAAPVRALMDAFAEEINYYLDRHALVHPRLITHFEPWHMLAFNRYALYYLFLYGETGIPKEDTGKMADAQGSNMWAIRPSKSATGHAMLFINPHQPFFGPGRWYEGHVHSESGWDISGASFFGSAFPTLGNNEHLGWSHTVNKPDVFDVWEETFDKPRDPLGYRYDGGYREATAWTDSITIKTDQGPVTRSYKMMKTHHGPVVARRGGKSLTVRFARFEEAGQIAEWYQMSKSRNLAESGRDVAAGSAHVQRHVRRRCGQHLLPLQRRSAAPVARFRLVETC